MRLGAQFSQKHGTSEGLNRLDGVRVVCTHFHFLTCVFMSVEPWSAGESNLKCTGPRLVSKGRLELKR